MAKQSRTGLENQDLPSCHAHAFVMWIQSANSHTGQQHHAALQAGQMAAIDLSPIQIYGLRSSGRPQMADVDPALEQQVFQIAQRQRIANVHHHHEADHLGRGVETPERTRWLAGAGMLCPYSAPLTLPAAHFGLTMPRIISPSDEKPNSVKELCCRYPINIYLPV